MMIRLKRSCYFFGSQRLRIFLEEKIGCVSIGGLWLNQCIYRILDRGSMDIHLSS